MKFRIVVSLVAVAFAGSCSKKKEPAPAGDKAGSSAPTAETGSGSGGGSGSSATPTAGTPDPKLVARGEYLTNLFGCGVCHMGVGPHGPDPARAFAGGLEVPERGETWRSPNITPDKGSGIGSWTDEQIIAAIREGVRPDGSQLYVVMPYTNYNRMTDDDAKAVVAFLRTVPPVENVVAPNKLKAPKVAMPKPANQPDDVNDPMKHGEYLVTMMHCNMCHMTLTKTGPDMEHPGGGGAPFDLPFMGTGTLYAKNISSDPETGIGKWSTEDIAKAVKTMTRPDGSVIQGPMQFYLAGWSKLEDRDLQAIATYVKAIPAVKNKVPESTFKPLQGPPPGAGNGSGSGSAAN
jgi:hypothetical protein